MIRISRRRFLLGASAASICGVGIAAGLSGHGWWEAGSQSGSAPALPEQAVGPYTVEAHYYTSFAGEGSLNCTACHNTPEETLPVSYCHTPHSGSHVQCSLCPHRCVIASGERGICRVRENRGGRLYSLVYGNACAAHVDPIEKKPFYHFLPSATAFSIATAGCNLRCLYCQNWNISQMTPEETENADLPPESVVHYAQQAAAPVIAYTYSEPTAFFEYMMACARLGREAGLRSAVISAGFIEQEPLRELCQAVDAIKIDLKGYDAGFYRKVCSAELAPVLRAIETIFRAGVHLEIVNLVVPGLNDNPDQLRGLARWVANELSPDVPLHFSRFMPQYKLANLPPTPVESLDQARQVAGEEGLRFVYVGNVPGHPGNNTYCPVCSRPIIVRAGFTVTEYHLTGGACAYCETPIPGVWWPEGPSGKPPIQVRPGPSDQ
jgi:pyruvate formate lyase activating enzyme